MTNQETPLAYHITFSYYGWWLHGKPGSVDRRNNQYGSARPPVSHSLFRYEKEEMTQPPYLLDAPRRKVVMIAIREVCDYRGWTLLAAHVRSRHVHTVVQAGVSPEKVMNDFKAYASRRLNREGFETKDRRRWARHGSTVYKWTREELENTMSYVLEGQGEPLEVYVVGEADSTIPPSPNPAGGAYRRLCRSRPRPGSG
jgi:REP element-mobilizing transposase RayT